MNPETWILDEMDVVRRDDGCVMVAGPYRDERRLYAKQIFALAVQIRTADAAAAWLAALLASRRAAA
jgi:hypothetical protein